MGMGLLCRATGCSAVRETWQSHNLANALHAAELSTFKLLYLCFGHFISIKNKLQGTLYRGNLYERLGYLTGSGMPANLPKPCFAGWRMPSTGGRFRVQVGAHGAPPQGFAWV